MTVGADMLTIYAYAKDGTPPDPVDITVDMVGVAQATFELYDPGGGLVPRDPKDHADPSGEANWHVAAAGEYDLHITPTVMAGTSAAGIEITQNGKVIPTDGADHKPLGQPISYPNMPNGQDSTVDLWINLV